VTLSTIAASAMLRRVWGSIQRKIMAFLRASCVDDERGRPTI
jgi:hypothetical protein